MALNLSNMLKAPITFEVTMKPKRKGPELAHKLTAFDRDEAAREARRFADNSGFRGYAITRVREVNS